MKKDPIKVKKEVIKLIYHSLIPIHYKLNSCLEDIFQKKIAISEPEKALLLEFTSHANTLKIVFEEYFETFSEKEVIELPQEEYLSVLAMAKSVEAASRANFGNIYLWDN